MAAYTFDEDAFRRTRNAVRLVENSPLGSQLLRPQTGFPSAQFRLVKPDADIAADASGTCSVFYSDTKGSETDTSEDITGFTRTDVGEGKWCLAVGLANGWELIPLEC